MSILPSMFRSTCLQASTSVFWPPTSTVLKYFQTSGFLSPFRSAGMTCLSRSLHFSRSTSGEAGELGAFDTISECLGLDPQPARAAETTRSTRVLDMSMAATVGRNGRFIKSAGRVPLAEPPAILDRRPMVMHGHAMARKKISTTIYIPPSRTSSSSSSIRRRASPWLSTFGRESISCSTRKGTISPGSFRWRSPTAVDPHNTAQTPAAERSTFHVAHCRTLMPTPTSLIRNFSIIAHIDHGKSTLADRLLDATGALSDRERKAQFLDSMDLERERGITIKAATVRLSFQAEDRKSTRLNLIDTPGHVDFHYEVSRSLAACEGAVLVVDASQGVEAQTLANVYLAVNHNLTILPVINKIDLPAADPENVRRQIEEVIGIDASEAILASAKEGKGIHEILEAVVAKVPPPVGDPARPLRVLLLDSWYDSYRGVVILVRVVDGVLRAKQKVRFMAAAREYEIATLGVFAPFAREIADLGPGEV